MNALDAKSSNDEQLCAAEILTEYSKEFDLDALDEDQKIVVEGNLVVPYLLDATVYFVIVF